MITNGAKVFKVQDDGYGTTEYDYFINGWFKNKGKRSQLSFYNRYMHEEEYYNGSYWQLNGMGLDLSPSEYYNGQTSLGQTKIAPHSHTSFSLDKPL